MTDPRAGEESATLRQKIEANIEATGDWKGRTPEEVAAHHESIDLDTTPIPEERAGREATCPAIQALPAVLATQERFDNCRLVVNSLKAENESLEAQLAAQPSVQRIEDQRRQLARTIYNYFCKHFPDGQKFMIQKGQPDSVHIDVLVEEVLNMWWPSITAERGSKK